MGHPHSPFMLAKLKIVTIAKGNWLGASFSPPTNIFSGISTDNQTVEKLPSLPDFLDLLIFSMQEISL